MKGATEVFRGRNSLSWYRHQTCWIMKTQAKGVVSQDVNLDSKAVLSSQPICSFQWSCLQHSLTKGFTDTTKRWQSLVEGQGRSWLHCWSQILWNDTLSVCCGKNSLSSNTCQRFAKHLLQTVRTQTQQTLQTLLEVLLRWCSHQIICSWKNNHKTQKKKKSHPAFSDFFCSLKTESCIKNKFLKIIYLKWRCDSWQGSQENFLLALCEEEAAEQVSLKRRVVTGLSG